MKKKIIKRVTLPLLKIKPGIPVYVKIESPMFVGKKVDDKKEPATLAHVLNLETGEEAQIIVPALLKGNWDENYKGNSYVDKQFEIILTRVPEKRYNLVSLTEIEVDPDDIGSKKPEAETETETPAAPLATAREVADAAAKNKAQPARK